MSSGPEQHPENKPAVQQERHRVARRAFLSGSLAAGPLIMSVASRPAWAGCGQVSVMNSLTHESHAVDQTCYGQTPEYWRMNPDMVATHAEVGLPNPTNKDNIVAYAIPAPYDYTFTTRRDLRGPRNQAKQENDTEWLAAIRVYRQALRDSGGTYPEVPFGTNLGQLGFNVFQDSEMTVMQALFRDDLQLVCQSACAWLNASENPTGFGYSKDDVVTYCNTLAYQDPDLLLAAFTAMNNASTTV